VKLRNQQMRSAVATTALETFVFDLQRVRRRAGDPSHRELVRRAQHSFSISSITRSMKGDKLPTWAFTEAFLTACGEPDEVINSYWKARWVQVADQLSPVGDEVGQSTLDDSPPGVECTECGTWVINPERHTAWHMMFTRRPQRALQAVQAGPTPQRDSRERLG
jgi:hypothetical protein